MSTLTTLGLVWIIGGGSKATFSYPQLFVEIAFDSADKTYHVTSCGTVIFSHTSASVCLETISESILDHYAMEWEDNIPLLLLNRRVLQLAA